MLNVPNKQHLYSITHFIDEYCAINKKTVNFL